MKEITMIIDTDGTMELSLKGWETESPRVAKIFEDAAGGKPSKVEWNPKAHSHVTVGHDHHH